MASSGSFDTNAYSVRYLTFNWWVNSQDIGGNYTDIGWNLVGNGGSTTSWYKAGNFKVVIDGEQVYYSSDRISLYNGTTVASGTKRIYHNSDGARSFGASAEAGIYYVAVNVSGSGSWELPRIARYSNISSADNFNDEQNPSMSFTNPSGGYFSLRAKMEAGGNPQLITRDISSTTTSCTFNLSEPERNRLRALCTTSNTLSVRFTICCMSGSTELSASYLDRTMTIVNGNPTFSSSNVTYKDNNSTTTAVTGNNQQLVQNLSELLVTITSATAKKSASISKYEATINGVTKLITSAGNIDYGVINSTENLTLSVKVTDSRGNSTIVSKTVMFLPWTLPSGIITLKRKNNYENETYLTVAGIYSSVNDKNTITITYAYKKTTESSYSSATTIANNTKITMTKDKQYAWNFQIIIKDKFGTITYNVILAKGQFIFFVDSKKLSVGINCFPVNEESLEINGCQVLEYDVISSW